MNHVVHQLATDSQPIPMVNQSRGLSLSLAPSRLKPELRFCITDPVGAHGHATLPGSLSYPDVCSAALADTKIQELRSQ